MGSISPGDLTTRARIRNAAIALIGEHGFERTSIRMIAAAAGVSAGLVVHHFGDKDGLRMACNEHVIGMFTIDDDGTGGLSPTIESIQTALGDLDAYGPALRYLAQMLAGDETGAADRLFDGILQNSLAVLQQQERDGVIRRQSDARASALLLTIIGLAPVVLARHFARALGSEELTPEVVARITIPLMELLTRGLYTDDSLLKAAMSAMPDSPTPNQEA